MHDLVHDLSKEILSHQINAGGNRCRYALLTDCSSSLQLFVAFPANIRALHFRNCGKQELCGGAFSPAKCLRVLDLSECSIRKLPDCIGQLKQLRFLHAPRIQDKMIPNCITELSELNYLDLRGSEKISALPESIGDMKALMHLDLSYCYEICELPVSFAELKQLVHLDLSKCTRISISEAFGGFTKLQYLSLAGIDADRRGQTPEVIESIGNLRKLHTLNLSSCVQLKKLPDSMVKMVSLKVLNVAHCHKLEASALSQLHFALLPHFVVRASSDQCTSNIVLLQPTNPDILTIDRLENVKSAEEAHSIKLMEKQKIRELRFKWTVAAGRFVDDKEVLEKLVPQSSVRDLFIVGYRSVSIPGWLMGIRQYLPNLSGLYLCDFPKLNSLPPLRQLPNLLFLDLCRMESLEEWNTEYTIGEEGANELMFPKLLKLSIVQCAKLRIKPCLPRVETLDISDCDNVLSSWGESSPHSGSSSSSPVTHLVVCDSKVPLHQWRFLPHLPALRKLSINNCSDLTTSSEIIQHLSSLESLRLKSLSLNQAELSSWLVELTSLQKLSLSECRGITSLPEWLGELTSFEKLKIEDFQGIRSLPDSIQQLTKLECLDIRGCPALVKWCESEENKMKLAHIRWRFLDT